ncbi:TonB-dependent receptor [Granulicella arctica]|uniref:TonB-dependent receptor n=1 Tax=Granulicella arctica TaxID=940613 RepID=UPI0021E0DE4E|nr:carboxypeptidase regulatory-like domain-containing protein [Granulicella arctica]
MRSLLHGRIWSTTLMLVLAMPLVSVAQGGDADVSGHVTDNSGAVIPAVHVTLTNADTGVGREVDSTDGAYHFQPVLPGRYTLAASAPNFERKAVTNLLVVLGAHLGQDISLSIGSANDTITVEGFSPQVNTESNEVGGGISNDQINKLPVNTRQFLNLALLIPGTSQDASRTFYNNVQIGGGSAFYSNGFQVDGVINTWAEEGEPRQNFPQGAVQEFNVFISQYPAEYGLSIGGLITVATKSGTNKFHGEGFELFRQKALNRPTPFQTTNPDFLRNQFGGDIGGPIIHDRTHFYAAYERTQTKQVYTVSTGHPDLYGANEGNFDQPSYDQMLTGRVDHQISNKQSLFVRYAQEWNKYTFQGCGGNSVRNCYNGLIPRISIVGGHTWALSPNLVDQVHFQYARAAYELGPPSAAIPTNPSTYSTQVLAALQTGYVFPSFSYGFGYAETGVESRWELNDTLSYIWKNHNFRAGVETSYIPFTDGGATNYNGTWAFSKDQKFDPTNPATIAALTAPTSYSQTIPFLSTFTPTTPLGLFVEDEWKIIPTLTANIGLRYDRQFGSFDERLNLTPAQALIPFIGNPHKRGDGNNLAPRFGLVWDPSGKARDVVRAGYGIYYNNIQTLQTVGEPRNLLSCSITINSPNYPDPFNGKTALQFCSANNPNVTILAQNFQNPYAQQFSAGYSRQLSPNLALQVDGLYTYGLHDYRVFDMNYPTAYPQSAVRRQAGWAQINAHLPIAASKYKALFVHLDKRMANRYLYSASYTLSSAKDNNPQGTVNNPLNPGLDWGPGSTDRRHAFVGSVAYQARFGIMLSAIYTVRSSLPLSAFGASTAITSLTPSADSTAQYVPGTTRNQFNRDISFAAINAYRAAQGVAPLSTTQLQNSNYKSFDLRVLRDFRVHESMHIEAYGQAFNLFGHVNYVNSSITSTATSSTFGRATSATNLQQAELGARFVF